MEPLLKEKCQDKVFYDIEAPLLPVLTAMECEGVKVDASALAEFSESLSHRIEQLEKDAHKLAQREFNLKSPKQLGEVLFDELKVSGKPKKTKNANVIGTDRVPKPGKSTKTQNNPTATTPWM